jgi:hypothetical protein
MIRPISIDDSADNSNKIAVTTIKPGSRSIRVMEEVKYTVTGTKQKHTQKR